MNELLPRPGLPITHVLTQLRHLINGANNTRAAAGNVLNHRETYLAWVSGAESQLRNLFATPDVAMGLHTNRYWSIADLNARTPRPSELIMDEATWQAARLEAIFSYLDHDQKALSLPSDDWAAVVPDTNVLLHYGPYEDIKWPKLTGSKRVRLVVPLLVIDELDDLSFRSKPDTYERAKGVIKSLRESQAAGEAGPPSEAAAG